MFQARRSIVLGCGALLGILSASCKDAAPPPKPPTPAVASPTPAASPAPAASPTPAPSGSATPGGGQPSAVGAAKPAPPAKPPSTDSTADSDPARIDISNLTMTKPVTWIWQKPTMQFRTLQYSVPAGDGKSPAAELVFSVFGESDGGPLETNIDRWANQFKEDGQAATPKVSDSTVNGIKVTRVELKGPYMMMGAAAPRPGYEQLAAIAEPDGRRVFIRLVGPEGTVESARKDFDALVSSIRENAPPK